MLQESVINLKDILENVLQDIEKVYQTLWAFIGILILLCLKL